MSVIEIPTLTLIEVNGGLPGARGFDGAAWFDGAGRPGLVSGAVDGDWYVDTLTADLYRRLGGLWVLKINYVSGAAASASSAAASAYQATATASSAADAAAEAAASAAFATQASLSAGVYPTFGATSVPGGVATGKSYWVVSADGLALLLYRNDGTSTPAAVLDGSGSQVSLPTLFGQQAITVRAVARALVGSLGTYPVTPLIDLDAGTIPDTKGAYWRNSAIPAPAAPINIVQASATADIVVVLSGGTQTSRYAAGPAGKTTAMRLQLPNGALAVMLDVVVLPAGTYTAGVKVRSTPGAGTQALRFGLADGVTLTNFNSTEASFQQVVITFGSNGSASVPVCLFNQSGSAVDILVDELQVVPGSTLPAFSASGIGHGFPDVALPGRIPTSGSAVDLRGGVKMRVPLPTYPDLGSVPSWTMMVLLSSTDAATSYGIAMSLQLRGPATDGVGVSSGDAWGGPARTPNSEQGNFAVANTGWHVLAARCSPTESAFFLDGFKIYSQTSGDVASAAALMIGGPDSSQFAKGLYSQAAYWSRWLSDIDIAAALAIQKTRQGILGLPAPKLVPNFWLAEGDSITAFGSSYFWQYFGGAPTGIIGRDFANGGATLIDYGGNPTNNVTYRMAQTLPLIQAAVAGGMQPIVSLLIGANDYTNISIANLRTAWGQFRSAGAKVIACTILPSTAHPDFNSIRNAINVQIRADLGTYYDALADFAADPVMGPDNAPATTGHPSTNWQDETHPLAPGHAILKGIIGPVVDGLKAPVVAPVADTGTAFGMGDTPTIQSISASVVAQQTFVFSMMFG